MSGHPCTQVESARADRMGVSFGIDFSSSANLIVLPPDTSTAPALAPASTPASAPIPEEAALSVAAATTTSATSVASAQLRSAPNTDAQQKIKCSEPGENAAKACADRREGRSLGENLEISATDSTQPATGSSEGIRKDGAEALRGEVEIRNVMSARVSTEAFRRTLVARIVIRDPKIGGTIKTSCSWELLEPPERTRSTAVGGKPAMPPDHDSQAISTRRQLRLAQSLGIAGDYDDGVLRAAADRIEEISKRCRMHGVLYVDQDFPPNDSSLGPSLASSDLIVWRRPGQVHGTLAVGTSAAATAAFGGYGPPRPSDVRPCVFAMDASLACALAALAERPRLVSAALCGRVEEVVELASSFCGIQEGGGCGSDGGGGCGGDFRSENDAPLQRSAGSKSKGRGRKTSRQATAMAAAAVASQASTAATRSGMFSARLCVDGIWKEFVLDDLFPCLSSSSSSSGRRIGDSGGPCLSRAHGSALWVSMLEKAYARAVGSYSDALGGCCLSSGEGAEVQTGAVARPAKVLGVFTGAPVLQVE
ncbi:unnamed protein product, partial [Hapterophycus canaliculatus]